MLAVFLGFLALGAWQVKRLFWKLDLIERVDRRVHAAPVPAPGVDAWPAMTADSHEYLHVRLSGTFLYAKTARVQALSRLGAGFWLLTPLRGADGVTTLVNRGFIAGGARDEKEGAADAPADVVGLLRISEPHGGFLRKNDAAGDRWFSRDVAAIAASRQLEPQLERVAPYFIDAEDTGGAASEQQRAASGQAVGGLTVISFPNNHLVYALTWFGLALMTAGAVFWIRRDERRRLPDGGKNKDGKRAPDAG